MAGETIITVEGNLTSDPELRFTPSGSAVANFTIASTPRTFDRQSNEWKDGETLFLRAGAWRELAENVAETLVKGMGIIATGKLKSRSYETKEGEKRTVIELEVENIGPSLKWATAQVKRAQRNSNQGSNQQGRSASQGGSRQQGNQQGGGFGGGQQGGQGGYAQTPQGEDPWATPGVSNQGGGWGNGPDSEPPF